MSLIEVKNISMNYHSLKGETEALRDINFSINKGDFVSIIGPSGCGKSTVLNIISALITPSEGTILYKEEDIKNHLDDIGYMFQRDNLFEWLTVWENVILGLKIKKILTKENKQYALKLLKDFDLLKFKCHYPRELSGGMRQRVSLIRTLTLKPETLFLDEPFSALDYQSRLHVCDEVQGVIRKTGKTALMVTHDLGEAITTSDKIIIMTKGPGEIKKEVDIKFKNSDFTPFMKRREPEFNDYFQNLWKELDGNYE